MMISGGLAISLTVILTIVAIVLIVVSLLQLGRSRLAEIIRFLWVLLILLMPVIGSIAFFLVRPGKQK